MTLRGAVQRSRLEGLEALRDRLAEEIEETGSARDLAALSRQLTDVMIQIEELTPVDAEADPIAALVPDE